MAFNPPLSMVMRGAPRKRDAAVVTLGDFAWDRSVIATLRHSTLPWNEGVAPEVTLPSTPLAGAAPGARDRLSLLAQFAAHEALLQFAGIPDGELDPSEWVVVQKRGCDCRLVRVAARACDASISPPPLTLAQQFAEVMEAPPLAVLAQSWARAETIYVEALRTLREDAVADLRWIHAAAVGEIRAPGPAALRTIVSSRGGHFCASDPKCVESIQSYCTLDPGLRVILLGGAALPSRYGAIEPLRELIRPTVVPFEAMSESEVAEAVASRITSERVIFVVGSRASFDPPSWRVVELLTKFDGAVWIFSEGTGTVPESRFFVVARTLAARRSLDERLAILTPATRRAWIERIDVAAFAIEGEQPSDDACAALAELTEPTSSYIAALALLGPSIPRELAGRFLARFFFDRPLEALAIDGVTAVREDAIVFESSGICEQAARMVPAASRPVLCRLAADVSDPLVAASLLIEAEDFGRAAAVLEGIDDLLPILRKAPRALFERSPSLAARYAQALVDAGRYRDAREIAPLLTDECRELVLARCERRTGDYAPALARTERLGGLEADLLRAELLSITGRGDEAGALLDACEAPHDPRVMYARAVLDVDRGRVPADVDLPPYLAARLATYREPRLEHVEAALRHARTATERADALLDRVYVLFSAGRWDDARAAAMEALAEVDDTQGDRAAGGFLFFLAYLAADDGQWAHAAQRITRLRHFYANTNDELRLAELDLLTAHLEFSRGRFETARRAAANVLARPLHPQILEAAALIVDEIAWIEGADAPLRSSGNSGNVELDARHQALRDRALASGPLPEGKTRSEKLKLFRAALARRLPLAGELAKELGIEIDVGAPVDDDVRMLRAMAMATFPFAPADIGGARWRFATRNRLGHWSELGSEPFLQPAELDRVAASGGADWIIVSERELLFIDGCSRWCVASREAVAALVVTKAENRRLRRIVEQEESVRAVAETSSIEGIVGESPMMRDVYAMIPRVARRDVAVCIVGESGTGKELVARAIHRHSGRRGKTFTPVNCAALPENLIESELFGHVRGAFTGADRDRPGLVETSDGGTLFLDEIGEMPLAAQAKLLRFLQEGEFRRVGETVNRTADVRIVSATNRKLEAAVEDGRFREDLYYRIRGVEIALPPLRDRGTDVALLAAHFLIGERTKHRAGPAKLSPDVEAVFRSYKWPGNVRELQNAIRAAHAMAGDAKEIDLEHLPERLRGVAVPRVKMSSYQDEVARFRRELIERSLVQVGGNQNQAAALLNISRQALAYQIRELGIMVGKTSRKTAGM
jgi:DNA-binding NtrC family response regulator/tetratricopeptide (TPR) repeat protein